MNKQHIFDAINRLEDQAVQSVANSPERFTSEWFSAIDRAKARQRAEREPLQAACAATGGHLFMADSDRTCFICDADRDAAKKLLFSNLLKAA